jgi:hypothetical protein
MLDTPRSEVVWEYWLPTPFASFPFTSPLVRQCVPPHSEHSITPLWFVLMAKCLLPSFLCPRRPIAYTSTAVFKHVIFTWPWKKKRHTYLFSKNESTSMFHVWPVNVLPDYIKWSTLCSCSGLSVPFVNAWSHLRTPKLIMNKCISELWMANFKIHADIYVLGYF